jgi:hypothetical protein
VICLAYDQSENIFLQQLTIAFAKGDADYLLERVSDDIRWEIVGAKVVEGRPAFTKATQKLADQPAEAIRLAHIASHGKVGAVDGTLQLGRKRYGFCDMYEFRNARAERVSVILSFRVALKVRR